MNRPQATHNVRARNSPTPSTGSQPSRSAKKSTGVAAISATTAAVSATPRRVAPLHTQVRKRGPPVEVMATTREQLDQIDLYESTGEEEEDEIEDSGD